MRTEATFSYRSPATTSAGGSTWSAMDPSSREKAILIPRGSACSAATWLETASQGPAGTIQLSRAGQVIYSASTGQPGPIPDLWGLWTFGGHWALEVLDNTRPSGGTGMTPAGQVILDGVSLNQRYGYQELFGFSLLRGQPFYFFRKDGKIGAAYAGQPVLLDYDSIPHYGCCSAGELNPRRSGSMVWFFAEREGAWYYVEIGNYL